MFTAGEPPLTHVWPHSHCHTVPTGYSYGVGGTPHMVPAGSVGNPSPLLGFHVHPGEQTCFRRGR